MEAGRRQGGGRREGGCSPYACVLKQTGYMEVAHSSDLLHNIGTPPPRNALQPLKCGSFVVTIVCIKYITSLPAILFLTQHDLST